MQSPSVIGPVASQNCDEMEIIVKLQTIGHLQERRVCSCHFGQCGCHKFLKPIPNGLEVMKVWKVHLILYNQYLQSQT